jgi:hypothetical protein
VKRPATGVPDEWSSIAGQPAGTEPGLQAGWHYPLPNAPQRVNRNQLLSRPIAMSDLNINAFFTVI